MIFEDPESKRWRRALQVFSILVGLSVITIGLIMAGYIVPPSVPKPFERRSIVSPAEVKATIERNVRPKYTKAQFQRMAKLRARERWHLNRLLRSDKTLPMPLPSGSFVAFSLGDDPDSVASLEKHITQLDVVIPDWFEVSGNGCELIEKIDKPTQRILSRSQAIVLPRLANFWNNVWRGEAIASVMRSDKERTCLVKKITERFASIGADGINVDIEELAPEDSEPLLEFLVELRASFHAQSMRLTVDVPFHDPAYDIEYIGNVSDAVMVMAYDEHYPSSSPGPIASRKWLEDSIEEFQYRLPADRMVIVVGIYGYDWNIDKPSLHAESLSFRKTMDLARAAESFPVFEEGKENGDFGYRDEEDNTHEVWFQDSLAIWNQIKMLQVYQISRVGFWRLGTEDETLWTFLGQDKPPSRPDALKTVPPGQSMEFYGTGEILTIRSKPSSGYRQIVVDPTGRILSGNYTKVPSGLLVERRQGNKRQVVLTFDDGPSEIYTSELLKVLRELRAPATFFVVGEEIMREPDLVEQEAEDGHLVGNHSFSHPHMGDLTPREAAVQLNVTQRLIEGLTYRRTPLFRAPFTAHVDPDSIEHFKSIQAALDAGYVVLGANVDSRDWDIMEASGIVDNVIEQLDRGIGQVVLFHDGGGDRSQTVEAIRLLVPRLRTKGYEIVSLDKYMGIPRSEIETPLPLPELIMSFSNATYARIRAWGWTFLAILFFVCTILAILRILFLGSLTLYELWSRPKPKPTTGHNPLVTVLIPAYNEEKVIGGTLNALLASDYQNLELLVIDDGSKDKTAEVVREISSLESRVRLLQQTNQGKAVAANHGLQESRGEIIVAVDADTVVSAQSISKLVRHFSDEKVTAVCGNVEVGNVRGFLTTFQAIEYVTSQNFDRRAFSALNCISVVPGALGAWRKTAVVKAGGYSRDTLTEDADLTLTILRSGGKVIYEAEAIGRTEAPETLTALLKQRFRWTYGTYQCLWKHKAAFFKGTLGWVGMPNMVLFQILFPTLSPIGDVVMLLAIFRGDWGAFLVGYVAFLAMDMCASLLAFSLDHKPLRWLGLLLIQRFSYRQFMYYVSLKAIVAAVRGARHGWKKLERIGSVGTGLTNNGKHSTVSTG